MDYQYEQLGPDRFQQLCQALLVEDHPDLQCLPVGQADGGRDAFVHLTAGLSPALIFQVKFTRDPSKIGSPVTWLSRMLDEEAPKIRRLERAGAARYVVLTNVRGTAAFPSGTIDRISALLAEKVPMPSSCLWRDDLDRRVERNLDLRWSYPELLTGVDILRLLLEKGLGADYERQAAAVDAFLEHQYNEDREVQFQQIDLKNRLFDLFVDVPCVLNVSARARRYHQQSLLRTHHASRAPDVSPPAGYNLDNNNRYGDRDTSVTVEEALTIATSARAPRRGEGPPIGAATFLLHPAVQERYPFVVVEGAPGQGKSTLGQYLCQVHRVRLRASSVEEVQNLPIRHRQSPLRLPIKADLRDFAVWLTGSDPFSRSVDSNRPPNWNRTLEAFLAHQVSIKSGGVEFSVADLRAVFRTSAVLLLLDGTDEVADIEPRKHVVDEISEAVLRLRSSALSLQVVVTSRPVAFTKSPGLSEELFQYVELRPISGRLIEDFARRWARARTLSSSQTAGLLETLAAKLTQPHVRDLARNPMQLAILLALIHTRGASLPDKRTSLYDSYVRIFFDREVEKSELIMEHRDLIVDIHRYLGWHLHAASEVGDSRGRISGDELTSLLETYLRKEGRDPGLALKLFGGLDRLVLIVSRLEGTYEFEVQTVREYFAARHLYETAGYSPPGAERGGTKPDRFDAIARNFYWLNVARFFAGCYSKGELPSLAESLEELYTESPYSETSHPFLLSAMLLSDWVFSQSPKAVHRVVDLSLSGSDVRHAWMTGGRATALPEECGRARLVEQCLRLLYDGGPSGLPIDLLDVLLANCTPGEMDRRWSASSPGDDELAQRRWLNVGLLSGSMARASSEELVQALRPLVERGLALDDVALAGRDDVLSLYPDSARRTLGSVLDGALDASRELSQSLSITSALALTHDTLMWSSGLSYLELCRSVRDLLRRLGAWAVLPNPLDTVSDVLKAFVDLGPEQDDVGEVPDANPLPDFLEYSRASLGTHWLHYYFATAAVGLTGRVTRGAASHDLMEESVPLLTRAQSALVNDSEAWWSRQLESTASGQQRLFVLGLLFAWAPAPVIGSHLDIVEKRLGEMTTDDFAKLARMGKAVESVIAATTASLPASVRERTERLNIDALPRFVSCRLAALLAVRAQREVVAELYQRCGGVAADTGDWGLHEFALQAESAIVGDDRLRWRRLLSLVNSAYAQNWPATQTIGALPLNGVEMPAEIARMVMRRAAEFPREVVKLADAECRRTAAASTVPVKEVASRDAWFANL